MHASLKIGLIPLIAGALAIGAPIAAEAAASGGVRLMLTCDTGPRGSGTFVVTANGKSSVVTVPCGGSATATNPAWMAGAIARIHQTAAPAGAFLARDRMVTLTTDVVTVAIRNFRIPVPAQVTVPVTPVTTPTTGLAQTGGSLLASLALFAVGIALATVGAYQFLGRRA
jgi:hypothetical protein